MVDMKRENSYQSILKIVMKFNFHSLICTIQSGSINLLNELYPLIPEP